MRILKRILPSIFVSCILSVLGAAALFGESGIYDRIGLIAEHGMHGAVPQENIDLFTGNLTLRFQDIRLPGPNGFDVVVWRVYNSKILKDRLPGSAWGLQQEPYSYVGLGWSMHMGRLHNYLGEEPVIEFPDGRWETAYRNKANTYNITRGFLKYDRNNYKLYFKDGTVWTFGLEKSYFNGSTTEQVRVVTLIENSYGHTIQVQYQTGSNPDLKKIIDSMGREIDFVVVNNRLNRIYLDNATNGTVNYYYTVDTYGYGGYHRLSEYNPPEISKSTYKYNSGQGDSYELRVVNTAYGGKMEYDYVDHTFYYQVYSLETQVVSQKRIDFDSSGNYSTWNYSYPSYNQTDTGTVTVDGPEYDTYADYFAYTSSTPWKIGLLKEKRFGDGSYSEENEWTGKEISNTLWTVMGLDLGTIKAPLLSKSIVTREGDAGSKVEYFYEGEAGDTYGLPTTVKSYGGSSGTSLKNTKTVDYYFETHQAYEDRYMVSHVYKETVKDAGGAKLKENQTDYYSTTGKYGAVDSIRRWKSGGNYLTWDYEYSSTNPNSITITIALPDPGGLETHKYSYGVQSELRRPGYLEFSRTVSQYNSAVLNETNQHGGIMRFTYDDLNRVERIDLPGGFNYVGAVWNDNSVTITQGGAQLVKYWDGMGRDTGYRETGDGTTLYYQKELDAEGRVKEESKGSTNQAHKYLYTLNASGNPTHIADPRGKVTGIVYSGDRKTVTDAKNHAYIFTYNHLPGLHTTLKDPKNRSAVYTYDGIGRVSNITFDGSRTQSYSYNGMDQVGNESHPETGTISYTYDTAGNLWQKTWAGTTTTYTYNTSNQLKTTNDGGETIEYFYDTSGRVGKIQGTGWTRENFTYNKLGSVTREDQTVTGLNGAKSLSYTYTGNNNLETVTYPGGRTVTYTDNGLNMPESVRFNGKNIVGPVVYGIHKKPTSIVVSGNGTAWTTVYNGMGLIESTSLKKGSSSVYSNSYRYDNVGNVEYMSNAAPDLTAGFDYDELNRLSFASYSGARNFQYRYDQFGNLEEAKENGTVSFSAIYNSQNRIVGGGYGYDGRGNIISAPGYTNTWDNRNRLEEVTGPGGETIGKFIYNERALRLKASRDIPPGAAIIVTAPVVGDTWYHFTTNSITWDTGGFMDENVTVLLYQGDVLVMEIVDETANDGEFQWEIFNAPAPGQYTVHVRTLDKKVEGASGEFTISGVPVENPFGKVTGSTIVTESFKSFSCNWGDFDDDGDQDLFVGNRGTSVKNSLFINDGDGNFSKAGSSYGAVVTDTGYTTGSSWGDFDNDGDLDIFVPYNNNRGNYLFQNNGSSFSKISSPFGSGTGDSRTGAFVDYNNDGDLDIYVSNRNQANYLYRNDGAGGFTRITTGDIVTGVFSLISGCWSDYDNDGDMDVFIGTIDGEKNYLYRNDGGGDFERMLSAGQPVSDTVDSSGGAWADYDNDGHMDILVSNTADVNFLYRNNGDNTFSRVDGFPADGGNSRGVVWADFDNDSNLDFFVTNRYGINYLYMNNGYGGFEKVTSGPVTTDIHDSLGCAGADIDNDGDIDVFTINVSAANYLYVNDTQDNGNNWVRVRCTGTTSNTSAIGAKVRVKAAVYGKTVWQMREISGHTSHMSQNSLITHFGLADAGIIEEIHVEWPSGNVQKLSGVDVNQLLTIAEVDSPAVNVKTPNGGELFASESVREIKWASHLVNSDVKIEYSIDDGASYSTVISPAANTGTYQWTVPPVDSSRCRVRVTGINDNVSDESNAPFTVSHSDTADLQLLTPNGGEQWESGSVQTISWNSAGLTGCISIEYSTDDGASYNAVIQCTMDDGAYEWTVPDEVSDTCRIRIGEYGGEVEDTSDAVFSITESVVYPTMTVLTPNGGESLEAGESYTITWGSSGAADFVKIEVSGDGGLNYDLITDSTANSGSFSWTVPAGESDTCKVRIGETGGTGGESDESDGFFSIVDATPPITVTSPNGGENLKVGAAVHIGWTSDEGIGDIKISYSADGHVRTIAESTENDGLFMWQVPDTPSSHCIITVGSAASPLTEYDHSDFAFAITTTVEDHFTRVTEGDIVTGGGTSFGCNWGDYDNDGDQDLFVANTKNEDNFLYTNDGDGPFTRVTAGPVVTGGG